MMNIMTEITGWLIEYTLYFWDPPHFNRYAAKFLAEICESYECLYLMYMNIMQVWIFESKIWSICISAYNIFMHGHVQEWRKMLKTYKETYRASGTVEDLGQPQNRCKGNRLVWGSSIVKSSLMYRYELGPKKQAIT